jgi:hypothetical protein
VTYRRRGGILGSGEVEEVDEEEEEEEVDEEEEEGRQLKDQPTECGSSVKIQDVTVFVWVTHE